MNSFFFVFFFIFTLFFFRTLNRSKIITNMCAYSLFKYNFHIGWAFPPRSLLKKGIVSCLKCFVLQYFYRETMKVMLKIFYFYSLPVLKYSTVLSNDHKFSHLNIYFKEVLATKIIFFFFTVTVILIDPIMGHYENSKKI